MLRTQIYLPSEMHAQLLALAGQKKTTMSQLVRQGASSVLKERSMTAGQKKALRWLANPPKKYLIDLKGKTAVQLIREDRDDD